MVSQNMVNIFYLVQLAKEILFALSIFAASMGFLFISVYVFKRYVRSWRY